MKAGAFALQSDQLRVSPSLVLVGQIFSAVLLNEACTARHCGANNSASFCAQMSDPVLTVSRSHNHTDKNSKSTFIALSPIPHELNQIKCYLRTFKTVKVTQTRIFFFFAAGWNVSKALINAAMFLNICEML